MEYYCPACKRIIHRDARKVKATEIKSYCEVKGKVVKIRIK